MSELNMTVSPTGFVGPDKENKIISSELANAQPKNDTIESRIKEVNEAKKAKEEQEAKLSSSEVEETVQEVNDFLHNMKRNLSFSIDEQLGQSVILVKDSESDEVIRQIPSEELVVLRKKMDDVVGILFDTKV